MKRIVLSWLCLLAVVSVFGQSERLYVRLSRPAGFYEKSVEVKITCNVDDATIYYTMDGSIPSKRSIRYRKPIKLKNTTVVRAIAVKKDSRSSIVTNTYVLNPETTFPIVSLSLNSSYLFDEEIGLFQMGPNADSLPPYNNANFWSRKEIQIHTEIFETDGERVFGANTGMRLFGGMSRLFPQKSMAIMTRSRYGPTRFRHKMFPEKDIKAYKYFVLRNAGSDFSKAHLRDPFVTSLVEGMDIEKQSYRPSHLYLNGEYWGIYNIREKINRYFVASHTDTHKDSMDLIEHQNRVRRGSNKHYKEMLKYMEKHKLSEQKHYDYIKTQMEVENFMDLQIIQIYIDNRDAGGNIKFWRPAIPNGRWRWILYDTDWGYGLHNKEAYKFNSLHFHLTPDGPRWPNPPWTTFILRQLIENDEFKADFINRFADHMNTYFDPQRTLNHLDSILVVYEPEIGKQLKRWNLSSNRRNSHLDRIRTFAVERPAFMRKFLDKRFDIGDTIRVNIEESNNGRIIFNNNIEVDKTDFSGLYFENYPVKLQALPHFGYKFSHWEGLNDTSSNPIVSLQLFKDKEYFIRAVYEKSEHPLTEKIMFNEISCNNKTTGDWVELFNYSKEDVNLKGWFFLDKGHEFQLPDSKLRSGEHIILCEDTAAFKKIFPFETRYIGNFPFGLSKRKERLELYSNTGAPIDSLSYKLEPVDSVFTLSLKLPYVDNSMLDNWKIAGGFGTPNEPNPSYVEDRAAYQRKIRRIAMLVGGLALLCIIAFLVYRNRHHFKTEPSSPLSKKEAKKANPQPQNSVDSNWDDGKL